MSLILDAIILGIILITVIFSAKRGFVRTVIELAGFIAALLAALYLGTSIAGFVYDKAIGPKLVDSTSNTVITTATEMVDAVWDSLPPFIEKSASLVGITKDDLSENILSFDTGDTAATVEKALDATVRPVFTKVVGMIFTVLLFVALTFIVKILARLLNKLFSFGLTGRLNKTLGGIIGVVKGTLFSLVFCVVVALVTSLGGKFFIFGSEAIEGTYVFRFLLSLTPFGF